MQKNHDSPSFFRSDIRWVKGDLAIPKGGSYKQMRRRRDIAKKAFVTKKGSLRIRNIGFEEAGIYTCLGIYIETIVLVIFLLTTLNYFSTWFWSPNWNLGQTQRYEWRLAKADLWPRNKQHLWQCQISWQHWQRSGKLEEIPGQQEHRRQEDHQRIHEVQQCLEVWSFKSIFMYVVNCYRLSLQSRHNRQSRLWRGKAMDKW